MSKMVSPPNNPVSLDTEIQNWLSHCPFLHDQRPTWDVYFLLLAFIASRRSSCFRNKVGAVIVKDKDVISTGYNSAPSPQQNCIELGYCYRDRHHIPSGTQLERCRSSGSHAESNAIALAAKNGHSTHGAELYLYGHQYICNFCRGIIANSGIIHVKHLRDDGSIITYQVQADWAINQLDTEKKDPTL